LAVFIEFNPEDPQAHFCPKSLFFSQSFFFFGNIYLLLSLGLSFLSNLYQALYAEVPIISDLGIVSVPDFYRVKIAHFNANFYPVIPINFYQFFNDLIIFTVKNFLLIVHLRLDYLVSRPQEQGSNLHIRHFFNLFTYLLPIQNIIYGHLIHHFVELRIPLLGHPFMLGCHSGCLGKHPLISYLLLGLFR